MYKHTIKSQGSLNESDNTQESIKLNQVWDWRKVVKAKKSTEWWRGNVQSKIFRNPLNNKKNPCERIYRNVVSVP